MKTIHDQLNKRWASGWLRSGERGEQGELVVTNAQMRWIVANQNAYVGRGLPGCDASNGLLDWTKRDMLETSLLALFECNRIGVATDRRLVSKTESVLATRSACRDRLIGRSHVA